MSRGPECTRSSLGGSSAGAPSPVYTIMAILDRSSASRCGERYRAQVSTEEAVSFQAGLLRHVQRAAPDLPVPRLRLTAAGPAYLLLRAGPPAGRSVRVISFLPGQPLRVV